jgi:hypothetical protein
MQNMNGIAANEGTALRELSLDEAEMVGGGFSWGGFFRGVEHLGHAVEKGMAAGFVTGGIAGALAGEGAGAAPGAVAGSIVGAVGGALDYFGI